MIDERTGEVERNVTEKELKDIKKRKLYKILIIWVLYALLGFLFAQYKNTSISFEVLYKFALIPMTLQTFFSCYEILKLKTNDITKVSVKLKKDEQ